MTSVRNEKKSSKSQKSSQDGKKSKGKSPDSRRSSPEKREKRKTGLSPPKSKSGTVSTEDYIAEIDKTQWEFSCYKSEFLGETKNDPNLIMAEQIGEATPLLAEERQTMLVRGEHLLEKPMYTLFALFVEIILILLVIVTWSCFVGDNDTPPVVLCFLNITIMLIVAIGVFAVQFGRLCVIREDIGGNTRYRVPYHWKYTLCMAHILRAILSCCNITTTAIDYDWDGGVQVMVFVSPLIVCLTGVHVIFALRRG
uniref:Uncharacterized protein n=1 Tax=Caenorhabditis japonica TaxID=281687 RepID=A0A8R1I1Y7_CAEJA